MTTALAKQDNVVALASYTAEQRDLIRKTAFPDSSDDELSLFLHVANTSGLDPLRRQLHPLRLQGRLVFVADINGLQARAAKEPDFEGLLHAVVYEKDKFIFDHKTGEVVEHMSNPFGQNGKPLGAWAICFRKGKKPFVSLVRFEEYNNTKNPLWIGKPGVMIDKCAKSSALRIAYPEQLGGIYERAELDAPEAKDITPIEAPKVEPPMSSVEATTKRMMAAGKGLAKDKPAPIRVVDVAPDQTEEEAKALTVEPDPLEAEAIRVSEALSEVVAKFNADPKGPEAPVLRKQIATLRASLAQLQAQLSV